MINNDEFNFDDEISEGISFDDVDLGAGFDSIDGFEDMGAFDGVELEHHADEKEHNTVKDDIESEDYFDDAEGNFEYSDNMGSEFENDLDGLEQQAEEEEHNTVNEESNTVDEEHNTVNEEHKAEKSCENKKDYSLTNSEKDFISDTGDIVVMDKDDNGDNFELIYCDIKNIGIVPRIRKNINVDDLTRSIKSTGLLEPVVVTPTATEGFYVLLSGYRRILACAKAGKRNIPCVVNNKVSTPEIPILEALYNHNKSYKMKEIVDYIDYLEKQKGIMNASMIEYLLQLNSGDYTKLKDILDDNDDEIVNNLLNGLLTIEQAFKKLEQRRKKETAEEKELKKAERVYGNEEESGVDNIAGSGEEVDEREALTDEEIKELAISPTELDEDLEDASLDEMVEEGANTPGFEAHKQKVGEREYIDPVIRKTVMARDNYTCACCKKGGESFVDALDYHHVLPVYLGGEDTPENGIALCLTDHRLVHLYATGDLYLPKEKSQEELDKMTEEDRILYNDEQMRFKRIVKLGKVIRDAAALKGMKREQLKKEHPVGNIGRNKPGKIQENA